MDGSFPGSVGVGTGHSTYHSPPFLETKSDLTPPRGVSGHHFSSIGSGGKVGQQLKTNQKHMKTTQNESDTTTGTSSGIVIRMKTRAIFKSAVATMRRLNNSRRTVKGTQAMIQRLSCKHRLQPHKSTNVIVWDCVLGSLTSPSGLGRAGTAGQQTTYKIRTSTASRER